MREEAEITRNATGPGIRRCGERPARNRRIPRLPAYRHTRRTNLRRMGKKPPRSFMASVRIQDLKIHLRIVMRKAAFG